MQTYLFLIVLYMDIYIAHLMAYATQRRSLFLIWAV